MKRKLIIILMFILLLAACSDAGPTSEPTTTPPLPATEMPDTGAEDAAEDAPATGPRPTVTPLATDPDAPGYPAVALPTTTPYPEGYLETMIEPTVNPYPVLEGYVWMSRAAGEQCAEKLDYPNLETAVSALTDLGVTVNAEASTTLGVCEACGCPTSLHYRVQVPTEEVPLAETLGWLAED